MKQYTTFFRIRFLAGLQYRAAAFAGFFTQLFWGLMEILMFRAFYLYAPEKLPMDMQALSCYVWIQQGTLSIWNLWGWELPLFDAVRTGEVAYDSSHQPVCHVECQRFRHPSEQGIAQDHSYFDCEQFSSGSLWITPDHFDPGVFRVFAFPCTDIVALRFRLYVLLHPDLLSDGLSGDCCFRSGSCGNLFRRFAAAALFPAGTAEDCRAQSFWLFAECASSDFWRGYCRGADVQCCWLAAILVPWRDGYGVWSDAPGAAPGGRCGRVRT